MGDFEKRNLPRQTRCEPDGKFRTSTSCCENVAIPCGKRRCRFAVPWQFTVLQNSFPHRKSGQSTRLANLFSAPGRNNSISTSAIGRGQIACSHQNGKLSFVRERLSRDAAISSNHISSPVKTSRPRRPRRLIHPSESDGMISCLVPDLSARSV